MHLCLIVQPSTVVTLKKEVSGDLQNIEKAQFEARKFPTLLPDVTTDLSAVTDNG